MKHCAKSEPEPTGLQSFREEHPGGDWDLFKENREAYSAVLDQICSDQRGLCAYCEIEAAVNNRQVAHFHPKSDRSGSVNWALHWPNLWMCCKGGTQTWLVDDPSEYLPPLPENRSCDENKMDKILDGDILSPDQIPAFPRIFRYVTKPDAVHIAIDDEQCCLCGINSKLATNTIDELNLNCPRLSRARLEVLRALEREITKLRKSGVKSLATTHLPAKWLGVLPTGHYRTFFTLLRWRLRDAGAEEFLHNADY